VSRVNVKAGIDRKASVAVQARGPVLEPPAPATAFAHFAIELFVTAQMVTSTGACWSSVLTAGDFKSNTITKANAAHAGP
jgi:hypothetical protein